MIKCFIERRATWFSVLFLALIFAACKKPKEVIGDNLVSDAERLGLEITDTLTLKFSTKLEDSLRTDGISTLQVGTYNDGETGLYNVSPSFHLRLSSSAVNFGNVNNIVVDSVRLLLAYNTANILGDSTYNLQLSVKELETDIFPDTAYYTNTQITTLQEELLEDGQNISFKPLTNTIYNGDSLGTPVLVLNLKKSFGEKIIAKSGQVELSDNENFVQFIKGLNVKAMATPNLGEGFVFGINQTGIFTSAFIYYRDTILQDTSSFELLINTNSATLGTVDFDLTGSAAGMYIANPDPNSPKAWVKSGGVLKTLLEIPNLKSLNTIPGLVINQAQLELPLELMGEGIETPHPQMFLSVFNKDSSVIIVPDLLEGESFFGGTLQGDKYVFRITQYLQEVLKGNLPNMGIQIVARNSGITSNRTVLSTENSLTSTPKIIITYSTF